MKSEIERNRRYLGPIVDTVIFTAKLGLAFRGHRDSGQIQVAGSISDINYTQGNLRALLQFKATGDPDLREHLTACKLNAQYVGHNSQNEIIQCIGDYITEKIVDQIKAAEYFTVIADGTGDISRSEQLSICVRYFFDGKIREEFVGFTELTEFDASSISKSILDRLRSMGLNLDYLVS